MSELAHKLASLAATIGHTRSLQLAMIAVTAVSLTALSGRAASSLIGRTDYPAHSGAAAAAPTIDLALITAAQLFGTASAAVKEPVAAPPVQLDWVLQGVFTGATPALGSAIIMTGQAPARLFQTDETLPGGATLLEVYPDRVLLELGDTVQTLRFPAISDSAAQGLRSMATARATGGSPGDAAGQTSEQRRELVRKRLEMLRQRALGSS